MIVHILSKLVSLLRQIILSLKLIVMDNLKVEGGNALISKLIGWVFQDARLAHDVKIE